MRLLAPVADLLGRESVTEVMVNGPSAIFYEEAGRLKRSDTQFSDEAVLRTLLNVLAQHAGRILRDGDFELDTSIQAAPQFRVHANFGAASPGGVQLTLRRISRLDLSLEDLVSRFGALTPAAADFLRLAVGQHKNVLISGGTGSGKTTILKCLCDGIPRDERIVLIEDTAELQMQHENVVSLLTKSADEHGEGEVTMQALFRSSLRLRPDRILIGEVRGPEAFDLVQALSSGHSGSLSTIHADNAYLAMARLEALALSSGVPIPQGVLRVQLGEVIHYIVQVNRQSDGSRKVERIDRVTSASDGWKLAPVFARTARSSVGTSAPLECTGGADPWVLGLGRDLVGSRAPALAAAMFT